MASHGDDDLVASKTEGYKIGEKKTVEEYAKLGRCHFRNQVLGIEDAFWQSQPTMRTRCRVGKLWIVVIASFRPVCKSCV